MPTHLLLLPLLLPGRLLPLLLVHLLLLLRS
jgi:hypothetical protein